MYNSPTLNRFKVSPLMLAMAAATVFLPTLVSAAAIENESTQLETITVQAEEENPAVTEGTKSYTAKSASTSTKLNLSLRETPQSVKVLTREYLDDANINSFQDMLNSVTGVTTNRWDERQYPTARGFDVDYYLFDGVPSSSELDTASDPDLSMYDRVELVKDANGLMTGAGNPAIAINMIRKHANAKELTGTLSSSYGSWNAWNSMADISASLNADGTVRGRVVVKHESTDSFADLYEKENNLFYGVLDADLTDSTYLSVGASYQELDRSGIKWGGLPAFYNDGSLTDFDRDLTVTSDWTYWNTNTTTAFAQFKQKLFNDITLNVNYDYREIDAETALLYLWSESVDKATNSSAGLYPYTDTSKTTQNNADVYISAPFTLGGLQQEVVAGFMYNQSELTDRYYGSPTLDNGTIDFNNFTPSKIIGSINNNVANPSNKTTQTGAYLAGKFTLLEPLKLVTGVRVSNWEYESEDGNGNRKYNNKVTPYAGLIYDFLEDYSWYASYTEIFKPENKQDANQQYLDPREGKSYETGLKGEFFDKQLNASMSVFLTQQDNVAEKIGSIKIGDEFKDVYSSTDSVESKGFEIELDGKITNNWDMSFGVAHFNVEDANGKKVQTTAVRTSANLFTKYTLDKWSLGGGLNYKSEAYKDEAAGRITQDAYVLANLMAAYQIDQNIKLQLNVNNLFDEKYYEGLGKNSMVYGAPRNATLTFRYQF
ncbi:TonB-dependent siderophore receptor [Acinetobacter johnsonii]|uniref:TonB-dependent siderophore receptor n=1 Tax=Acinetobacter johnsonii TaxID=40214 RepID=A0AA42QTA3_ACIJO|nr:TonB-dependent siderophore receptor [Acinetobacter johnsonii]MDH1439573.1 TonB-dependent siderophore receptor [Acinetobacter johnsonii]HAE64591.1 TonB-dependent siderophore receptor [Acinetobacter johnsonii]